MGLRQKIGRLKKHEAQLMLINPRDAFRGHGTIPYVRYDFLLVCYSNFVRYSIAKNVVTLKSGSDLRQITYGYQNRHISNRHL